MGDRHFIQYTYQKKLLENSLKEVFGNFSNAMLLDIEPKMEWVELAGGETLFRQGEEGDSLYFVISGRLRAFTKSIEGVSTPIGDIMRGEMVGDMAIFTGEKRMASIMAIRDSVLVKLTKAVFEEVIQTYPLISMNMTKIIINRLNKSQNVRKILKNPVNICCLPLTEGLELNSILQDIQGNIPKPVDKKEKVLLLTSSIVDAIHGIKNYAHTDKNNAQQYRKLTSWLDEQEAKHNFVFYVADTTATEWTKRCTRSADEIYLFADAKLSPAISSLEKELFLENQHNSVPINLVLLHDASTSCPKNTNKWLNLRTLKAHYHIRPELPKDRARLARTMRGAAIGLVLAGGGAKGFAHIGIYKALQEVGIPIDFVGGTSAGALMGTLIALDLHPEKAEKIARKGAYFNPTKDFSMLPFISLIKGDRLERMIGNALTDSAGFDINIEDTWLSFFTVSSNYTQAKEEVHTRGSLFNCLRASISIPGAFPPVVKGNDLLIDGGTFNNFPTNIMEDKGVGKIIGVDLSRDKIHQLNMVKMPSGWELLKDKFRPKQQKKYRLPSLMSILLNTTMLYSNARQKDAKQFTDLYFNPEVDKFGLMDWLAFDKIFAIGYAHAKAVLGAMTKEELAQFKD